jgi:hypothetical protein
LLRSPEFLSLVSEITGIPMANRCLLFETSEHSWHGFNRIERP